VPDGVRCQHFSSIWHLRVRLIAPRRVSDPPLPPPFGGGKRLGTICYKFPCPVIIADNLCEMQGDGCGESCVAVVVFRFTNQPEWLQEGAKFVVRDSMESSTAGAGVVRNLQIVG